MPIVWKDKMSVGNLTIDDEHKHLICLINSVEIALKAPDHEEIVRFLVHQLYLYTRDHFSQEEQIMLGLKYAGFYDHKKQHQQILSSILEMKDKIESHFEVTKEEIEGNEKIIPKCTKPFDEAFENELVLLLRAWIIDHVLSTDQKLKPLFHKRRS